MINNALVKDARSKTAGRDAERYYRIESGGKQSEATWAKVERRLFSSNTCTFLL
jgi:hypothetical protein